jgi:sucrose-6-phosphate hydrolase SacC (GH32 family)
MVMPTASLRKLLLAANLTALVFAQTPAYQERYRPQFHFSPKVNWTNDPNGLVYFNGNYHLFFQYNPFGDTWGHMSWGHATSRDLVHWTEQKVALPEENGVMIFTGSTVVDAKNTSGFCTGGKPCMVAVYTGHTMKTDTKPALQTQNLAYSNDGGINWTKFSGNPVLDLHMADFRDPKVFWSAASKQWIMVVSLPDDHKARFYGSPDLKKWTQISEFGPAGAVGGQWECPELFELPVQGGGTRWVLKIGLNPGGLQGGSGEQYFVGKFDGTKFINENPASLSLWTDYGKDCYCGLTFNNLPATQTQVMIGWMNNWQYANVVPTSPWRGQMTVPRELSLKQYAEGLRLVQRPVAALAQLRTTKVPVKNAKLVSGQTLELIASTAIGSAKEVGWKLLAEDGTFTSVGYDVASQQVFVDRTHSGDVGFSDKFPARVAAPFQAGAELKLHILIDESSVEVFAGDGQVTLTNLVYPPKAGTKVEPYAVGGAPGKVDVQAFTLKSIW